MFGLAAHMSDETEIGEKPGDSIGKYELIKLCGSGGMGEVWRAQQKGTVEQRVALKIVKLGMDTKAVVSRFETERNALALMDHPHIAKIFDGGATDTGRPYFVMEYVNGMSITTYARQAGLSIKQRLQLLIPACEAIQHAHQRGIIHRDLKPSNILVELVDGNPFLKIIDFGIAKATDGSSISHTMVTGVGQILGTLGYMSPEQAGLDGSNIDTRSDIYSLGAIMYELVTDVLPFDLEALAKTKQHEALKVICDDVPKKPSNRLHRQDAFGKLRLPRGLSLPELDQVIMKTLEKNPDRRYASAAAFADDIRRLLENRPVRARPDSIAYSIRKWLRRNHRYVLASLAGLLAIVLTGAVVEGTIEERTWRQRVVDASMDKALAIIRENDSPSASTIAALRDDLDRYPPNTLSGLNVRIALLAHDASEDISDSLWKIVEDDAENEGRRFWAAAALVSHSPSDRRWEADALGPDVALWLAGQDAVRTWIEAFRPLAHRLRTKLEELYRSDKPVAYKNAATLLAAYFGEDLEGLVSLVAEAKSGQLGPLVDALSAHGDAAADRLEELLMRDFRTAETEERRDVRALQQSRAGFALVRLGYPDRVTPHLKMRDEDPRLATFLIHGFAQYGVNPTDIVLFINRESPAWLTRAGLLALGEYDLTQRRIAGLKDFVAELYADHFDAGVHGAAEWLLRHWHRQVDTSEDADPEYPDLTKQLDPEPDQRWYVTPSGMTMTVIKGPVEFTMGVPEDEPGRQLHTERRAKEIPHRRKIPRSFAIASKELTFKEYELFQQGFIDRARKSNKITTEKNRIHLSPKKTLDGVLFNDALRYCNWLSEQEGIPEDQHCFVIPEDPKGEIVFKEDFLSLQGYRLATEAEWEYACRANSITARYYGLSEKLLTQYGWYTKNSENHAWMPGVLRPNLFGLFDMLGNRYEWVLGFYVEYPMPSEGGAVLDTEDIVSLSTGSNNPLYSRRGGRSEGRATGLTSGERNWGNYSGMGITVRLARTLND